MNKTRTAIAAAALALCATVSSAAGVEWVKIPGGTFAMGFDQRDEGPVHRVTVKTFELAKTEVTFAQYRACVETGACTAPDAACLAAAKQPAGDEHPVYCVNWKQAKAFSEWAGGRLPSEAEWEFAARGGGKKQTFPWGDEAPSCERAVFRGMDCGPNVVQPVCSKPRGRSRQGVCDLGGNVAEWVADLYHGSYRGAPTDGRAWDDAANSVRAYRGGAWFDRPAYLRAKNRDFSDERNQCLAIGIRPLREAGAAGGAGDTEWVKIPGGSFTMGSGDMDASPLSFVSVKPFEMSKSEVTFRQYRACVAAGACTPWEEKCAAVEPKALGEDHPVLCVDWTQARAYAAWVGGRLPSEAEWEYAARSAGKERDYPWGNEAPTCDKAAYDGGDCGKGSTRPVCTSPRGNTEQGLCDMAGNVAEWAADRYSGSYRETPADGTPRAGIENAVRPYRGGAWYDGNDALRAASRDMSDEASASADIGFRPARTPR